MDFQQDLARELRLKAEVDATRAIYRLVKKEYEFWLAETRDLVGVNRDGSVAFVHLRRAESARMHALEEYKTAVVDFNRFLVDRLGLMRYLDVGGG